MRYIGLDFGEKTIGVAVSDPSGKIALGLETVWRDKPEALRASVSRLGEIIRAYEVTGIVLGYPKHMDNTLSERCAAAMDFKAKLERNFKRVPVTLWDERLSTRAVSRVYAAKDHVDEMAAVYILQGYLDYKMRDTEALMDEEEKIITMTDDEGGEVNFKVLSTKEKDGASYIMAEEMVPGEDEEEEFADVLFFKSISADGDEIVFDLVDDEHEDFETVIEMFKEELEEFEIEMDTIELDDIEFGNE